MKKIWKYSVQAMQSTVLQLPPDAKVVRFAPQDGKLCVWVEYVVDDQFPIARVFDIFGTGHPFPDTARYVASCENGPYIWHLYEV